MRARLVTCLNHMDWAAESHAPDSRGFCLPSADTESPQRGGLKLSLTSAHHTRAEVRPKNKTAQRCGFAPFDRRAHRLDIPYPLRICALRQKSAPPRHVLPAADVRPSTEERTASTCPTRCGCAPFDRRAHRLDMLMGKK